MFSWNELTAVPEKTGTSGVSVLAETCTEPAGVRAYNRPAYPNCFCQYSKQPVVSVFSDF